MANLPANASLEDIENEIAFHQAVLQSLDTNDDDYDTSKGENEASLKELLDMWDARQSPHDQPDEAPAPRISRAPTPVGTEDPTHHATVEPSPMAVRLRSLPATSAPLNDNQTEHANVSKKRARENVVDAATSYNPRKSSRQHRDRTLSSASPTSRASSVDSLDRAERALQMQHGIKIANSRDVTMSRYLERQRQIELQAKQRRRREELDAELARSLQHLPQNDALGPSQPRPNATNQAYLNENGSIRRIVKSPPSPGPYVSDFEEPYRSMPGTALQMRSASAGQDLSMRNAAFRPSDLTRLQSTNSPHRISRYAQPSQHRHHDQTQHYGYKISPGDTLSIANARARLPLKSSSSLRSTASMPTASSFATSPFAASSSASLSDPSRHGIHEVVSGRQMINNAVKKEPSRQHSLAMGEAVQHSAAHDMDADEQSSSDSSFEEISRNDYYARQERYGPNSKTLAGDTQARFQNFAKRQPSVSSSGQIAAPPGSANSIYGPSWPAALANRALTGVSSAAKWMSERDILKGVTFGDWTSHTMPGEFSDTDYDSDYPVFAGYGTTNSRAHESYLTSGRNDLDYLYNDPAKTKAEIDNLLSNIRPDEDLPDEYRGDSPPEMNVNLMAHQKLGLAWLKLQEDGSNKGAILADDMGLGKTIQALALIATRRSEDPARKTNLIVAPVALLRQWELEIRRKVKTKLTVFVYHGATKKVSFAALSRYDIVLTTYGGLAVEYGKMLKSKALEDNHQARGPPYVPTLIGPQSKWYRVILDEAQCIKNHNTKTSEAAARLSAVYRLCMTGTPMMNNVGELYAYIRFLRIPPFNSLERFNRTFKRPLSVENRSPSARERAMNGLQALLKATLLRRNKKSTVDGKPILTLPERVVEKAHTVFSDDEDAFYRSLENQTQLQVNKYLKSNTVGKNYSNILVLLLRLRQACCHPHLIKDHGIIVDADISTKEMETLCQSMAVDVVNRIKNDHGSFECPICYDAVENPAIIFPCGHDLCSECFSRMTDSSTAIAQGSDSSNAKCPECRGAVDRKKIIDYSIFKKVHLPDVYAMEHPGEVEATAAATDSDSDSDTDSESDDDSQGDLDDFIVDDDAGIEYDSGSDDGKSRAKGKSRPTLKNESDIDVKLDVNGRRSLRRRLTTNVKDESDDETDDDDTSAIRRASRNTESRIKQDSGSETDDDDFEKRGALHKAKLETKAESEEETGVATTAGKRAKAKGKAKARASANRKNKGKGKKKEKSEGKKTLAQLKKEGMRNAAAKRKYLRRLRREWITSAKIEKTMELLRAVQEGSTDEKTIVFSQFTSMLDLLEVPVDDAGWGFKRYDGSMNAKLRNEAVEAFSEDPNCRIMLVSLKAGNAGLNLVMANHVIIVDPFWNPFIEEQAIDRAYRIGQKKDVFVHRVLVANTVEDRILALQDKKRELIEEALDENVGKNLSRLGHAELRFLFGIDHSLQT